MPACVHGHVIDDGETTCEEGHPEVVIQPTHSQDNNQNVTLPAAVLQQIMNALQNATSGQNQNNQQNVQQRPQNIDRPKRPVIGAGLSLEKWNFFKTRWIQFKNIAGLSDTNIVENLLECCEEDLRFDLHRNFGQSILTMTENAALNEIKRLAVTEENILISRMVMRGMSQGPDEDIKHFVARVKGQADICKYTITCPNHTCQQDVSYADAEIKDQLCKGLYDSEIQQDLLTQISDETTLHQILSIISTKESAKRSHRLLNNSSQVSKISQYKQNHSKNISSTNEYPCSWCGKFGHGSKSGTEIRREKCPAFSKTCTNCNKVGHFNTVCRAKTITKFNKPQENVNTISENSGDNDKNFVLVGGVASPHSGYDSKLGQIPHLEYDDDNGWVNKKSKEDPRILLFISICDAPAKTNGPLLSYSHPIRRYAIADTGARTTVAGLKLLYALGLSVKDLTPVQQKLCGANGSALEILGAIFLTFSSIDKHKKKWSTHQLCYIQNANADNIYLSRLACEQLGIINSTFPEVGCCSKIDVSSSISDEQCMCPKRSPPPKAPTSLPFEPIEENRDKLEKWLIDYYSSSTFNTCEHQTLPLVPGPPLHIMITPNAKPHAVHTPIPVPIHWQKKVKAGLDRDVRLGVIEPVPWGTPTTWCSRMVVVAKKDGTPRRTVDLQPLNAVSCRQTHHTPSPFHQASMVPNHTRKTVFDAWNGYHSVPIREEDRYLTTFITPWGRYRYCTTPQGYLAAGDAYTRRFDEIIADIDRKTKCVDDTIMWSQNIEQSFFQACEFLIRCGENGITLNPEKFQFSRNTVEFAGFEITATTVRPCTKYLEAIMSFPTPTDITGIRSWFGLVNQASYAFAITEKMNPFRELLKPGNPFYWDLQLQQIFEDSKKEIVEKIQHGVRIFDPQRKTCLITDWSKIGTGFLLVQKHCQCKELHPRCCNDGWQLVFAGSKFNNSAETRYAPIEGECLAVVKALEKSRYFVLGCDELMVATDHKPLLKILGDKSLAEITNPRLLKLKEKTLMYRFDIMYLPGERNSGADAVSRYPTEILLHGQEDSKNEVEEYSQSIAIASLSHIDDLQVVTWDKVKHATLQDQSLLELLSVIHRNDEFPPYLNEYQRFSSYLTTIDNVIMYKERILIPQSLRPTILKNLHSAHQGVTSMLARADSSVFWPGITTDIVNTRQHCIPCNKMAPSQPNAPPAPLEHPQYPFQQICADYFNYKGFNYLTIVDRYSNWPSVLRVNEGEGAKELIVALKTHCEIFGIPEQLSSDGGPQFMASVTQKFLMDWGIKHRVSSVAYPHSNCRAELAVKTMKRLINDNVGPYGTLNIDAIRKAMLQYKNTPDPDTHLSPAQIVFGRQLRDFTPVSPGKYKPLEAWSIDAEYRELALAKRHASAHERLTEHTKHLPTLNIGDCVYIQNQVGNHPRKWDKSGKVIEVKGHDQYSIKVDGSGRLSLRNRKFLRRFTPFCPTPVRSPRITIEQNPDKSSDISENSNTQVSFDVLESNGSFHQSALPSTPRRQDSIPFCPEKSAVSSTPYRDAVLCNTRNSTETPTPSPKIAVEDQPIRRSSRTRKPNPRYNDYICFVSNFYKKNKHV